MDWTAAAREHKQQAVQRKHHPTLPPIVIAEKGGEVWVVVESPVVDKHAGLAAAEIIKISTDPDVLVCIFDAYFKTEPAQPGDDLESAKKRFANRRLSKERAEGNPEVQDALICIVIDRDKNLNLTSLPYKQNGGDLEWLEPVDMGRGGGFLCEAMKQIMAMPLMTDHPLMRLAGDVLNMDPVRRMFHAGRGAFSLLRSRGFKVTDEVTKLYPGWCEE